MATVLIIGAGGVGGVVTHKCVLNKETFTKIVLASRRLESCEKIQKQLPDGAIEIAQVDADNVEETAALIEKVGADIVINVGRLSADQGRLSRHGQL